MDPAQKNEIMTADRRVSLKSFISREFFKAALIPLLIIEIALLVLYFLMNTYLVDKSVKVLGEDRFSHLMGITESQARIMGEQLTAVEGHARLLQAETNRFFNRPDQFPVPDPAPAFGFADNGVYYKLKNNGGCSLYYSALTTVGDREKAKARHSEALDPVFGAIDQANANIVAVYLNTFDSMSRYCPFFEDVHKQLPADMNIPEYNFYYLADTAHNPGRKLVWTAAYLDPMGMGWMMSCLAPIYRGDILEGVAGIDITIGNFIDSLLGLDLPWDAQAFLVDGEGTIMAMPPEVERIFGLSELHRYAYDNKVEKDTVKPRSFNLLDSVLSEIRKPVADLMGMQRGAIDIALHGRQYVLCQNTVPATGWKLMVIADRAKLLDPIRHLEKSASLAGYAAIGFMVLFYILFFLYLVINTRRMAGRIAGPIDALSHATQQLGSGIYETRMISGPVVELNALSTQFTAMARDLKALHGDLEMEVSHANRARDAAETAEAKLKAHQAQLESLVASRTAELTRANEELRQDIIKRQRAEKALDQERKQLLSIFDSIDEPVYISCPKTYDLLYVNEALKRQWPDYRQGKCHQVLYHRPRPCDFCTNPIIFGEKRGQAHIWENGNAINGRWYRCIDKAIQWPDGRMVRYAMAIDITEQKNASDDKQRLMARLQRAEKMEALGTLAGGVAHDLNNILGGIVGYPDLLLMKMAPDDPLRKSIETIRESGIRATAIVQDLLTLARRGVPVIETTNLNDVLRTYLSSPEYGRLLQYHPNILLKTQYAEGLLNCMGSPVHLSTMVMNLISNAAEAMPGGGTLSIATANRYVDRPLIGYDAVQEGEYVVLTITDSGIGIPADDLNRIFEPFYTKKAMGRSGTGLGMAVVWGTVKDHDGYIEVSSVPQHGTTFEIYLPATRAALADRGLPLEIDEMAGDGQTVLVVDDIEVQREIACEMLYSLGYTAIAVPSGEEAVEYLESNRVDMVLLDMIMEPNIDGLETYRRIIRIHPGQKALIVSGFSETEAIREAQRLGAGRYIKKPYTIHELGTVLREEMDTRP